MIVDEGKRCCYGEADAPDEEEGPNRVEVSGNVKDQSHYSAPCCQPHEGRGYRPHSLILGWYVKFVIARTPRAQSGGTRLAFSGLLIELESLCRWRISGDISGCSPARRYRARNGPGQERVRLLVASTACAPHSLSANLLLAGDHT